MVDEKSGFLVGIHQLFDLLLMILAFKLAFFLRKPAENLEINYTFILLLALICCHASLRFYGMYAPLANQSFLRITSKIIKSVLTGTAALIFLIYLLHVTDVSRLLIGYFVLLLIFFLLAEKGLIYSLLTYNRHREYVVRTVLIIGSRSRSIDLISQIKQNPEAGYRIRGCLETTDQGDRVGLEICNGVTVIDTMENFDKILLQEAIDEIIFALPLKKVDNIRDYIVFAEQMGINVHIMPDFQIQQIQYRPETGKLSLSHFLHLPTLTLSSTPSHDTALFIKAVIDYAACIIGILILSPLLIFIAICIKNTSRGPVFFTQTRCGLNGRQFSMYKFRTMVENAEELKVEIASANEMDGPVFKIKDDPRVTRIGRLLRKTSLDELPQLFNILKGEMSLVGPRPPLPEEVAQYDIWQRRRLSMKPGLTCIWQVNGRNGVSFEDWMKMDLEYIDNWSLLLDFKLLFLTIKEVLLGGGH